MIRYATNHDAKDIYTLELESFSDSPHKLSLRSIKYHIKNNFVLLSEEKNIIVGYSILLKNGRIYSLAVSSLYRKKGIGKALCQKMVEISKERGDKELMLEVSVKNLVAINLYKQLGFEERKVLKNYYGENIDGLKMVCRNGG